MASKDPVKNKGFWNLKSKTIWDWLELLIIPLVLAVLAGYLNWSQGEREAIQTAMQAEIQNTVEANRANANVLQAYLNDMSTLLLEEELTDEKVKITARARTMSVLSELDAGRNATVLNFLRIADMLDWILVDARLQGASLQRVDLSGANLSGANLSGASLNSTNLREADLSKAYLVEADLSWVDLAGADLSDAILWDTNLSFAHLDDAYLSRAALVGANLSGAYLHRADLSGASLSGADLQEASLREAVLNETDLATANLRGAILLMTQYDNLTRWPDGFDPRAAGAMLDDPD